MPCSNLETVSHLDGAVIPQFTSPPQKLDVIIRRPWAGLQMEGVDKFKKAFKVKGKEMFKGI